MEDHAVEASAMCGRSNTERIEKNVLMSGFEGIGMIRVAVVSLAGSAPVAVAVEALSPHARRQSRPPERVAAPAAAWARIGFAA